MSNASMIHTVGKEILMFRPSPTISLVRTIGEPVRLSPELVLTVVRVEGSRVRLKLSAPSAALKAEPALVGISVAPRLNVSVGTSLAMAERALIEATLRACRGPRSKPRAAALLGCSLKTLYNKLEGFRREDALSPVMGGRGTTPQPAAPE